MPLATSTRAPPIANATVGPFLFSEYKEREFAAKASEFFNNFKLKNSLN